MNIKPPPDPPDAVEWPPDKHPPRCDPECGAGHKTIAFIVIWLSFFKQNVERTHPVTLLPEFRNLISINENWWFMDQRGCQSPPPAGFDLDPQTTVTMVAYVEPRQASGRIAMWRYGANIMMLKGALLPGSIHYLADIATQMPPRGDFGL